MKRTAVNIAILAFALAAPLTAGGAGHDHGSMKMEHGGPMMEKGKVAHMEVVDGVKLSFQVITMAEMMKGMEMPKGMKETHHVMLALQDAKSGEAIAAKSVRVKVQGPDKSEQVKELVSMQGHFGADFILDKKDRYGVMAKIKLDNGKILTSKFWYQAP